jgi:hypothetical protein
LICTSLIIDAHKAHKKTPLCYHSGVLDFLILNWLSQRGN